MVRKYIIRVKDTLGEVHEVKVTIDWNDEWAFRDTLKQAYLGQLEVYELLDLS